MSLSFLIEIEVTETSSACTAKEQLLLIIDNPKQERIGNKINDFFKILILF